jgi:hypothetical protein
MRIAYAPSAQRVRVSVNIIVLLRVCTCYYSLLCNFWSLYAARAARECGATIVLKVKVRALKDGQKSIVEIK